MKKFLLSFAVVATALSARAQVVCAGVAPASVVGTYEFGVQTDDSWPGQAGDGSWDVQIDFNVPGTFIQDTLRLVEDGSNGVNPEGNPISQEGCNTLINDLTGKIAVIYRNTCDFGTKILNAQNAGAVAAIIVNREPVANFNMLGGTDGPSVTIPAVFLSSTDGETLINAMATEDVVVLIGNKVGAYQDDIGAKSSEALISPYGGANSLMDNKFDIGIQIYNYGVNTQSDITVTANIDGPSGSSVYNEVVNAPSMDTGDTLSIFNGNAESFPPFDLGGIGNYPAGTYTLTYTLSMGATDESSFDNVLTSQFMVNDEVISLAKLDNDNKPVSTNHFGNSLGEGNSCMFFQDSSASVFGLAGVYVTPEMDTAAHLVGEEIFVNVYAWNDTWVDLNDPNFAGQGNNNIWFTQLQNLSFASYTPLTEAENGVAKLVPLTTQVPLVDNQRYLVCAQSFTPGMNFGVDTDLDYGGNVGIFNMPKTVVSEEVTAGTLTWYIGGYTSGAASSTAMRVVPVAELGVTEKVSLEGSAFPNPAKDVVTVTTEANGHASLVITDISGKFAKTDIINLQNNEADVDISDLKPGLYVFSLLFKDGKSSQFNVVKK